jgi:large subunit ribosomal protein LP0
MAQKKLSRKTDLVSKLLTYFDTYDTIILVDFRELKANCIDKLRRKLISFATIVMGKNSLISKAINLRLSDQQKRPQPHIAELLPHLTGNIGLIFVERNIEFVCTCVREIVQHSVGFIGDKARHDVYFPSENVGLCPSLGFVVRQ